MQLGLFMQQAICAHTKLMLLVCRLNHHGKRTITKNSGIFQKQCIVIQRIGFSLAGGSCYMWYTIIKVLLLRVHPFLGKCPKVIMFSSGGTWKVLEKLLGCSLWLSIGHLCIHPCRIFDPGTRTFLKSSGIFQEQSMVILRIGLSWGGGSCYMWYFFLEELSLCAPPFLILCHVWRKHEIVFD